MAYYPRFIGGAEVSIRELTDRLSDDYEFHMITLRYDKQLPRVSQEGKVLVHRIGPGFTNVSVADLRKAQFRVLKVWFQFAAFLKARQLHKQEQYDAVWGMMAHSAGVPAGLFKRFNPEVPYLLSLQEGDPPEHIEQQMRIFGPLFKDAFRRADIVQALSVFLGDWGVRMGARKVVVIPNGVEVTRFTQVYSEQERSALRNHFGIPASAPVLFTSSRLVPKNGIDLVISALRLLPKDVHFLIAGDGPEQHRLQALAQDEGCTERVHFAGEIPQKDLPLFFAVADYFIRASRSEGQGIAFIESLAAGLPTIGTHVGGIPDFLHDGETGFVASACTKEAVAAAVNHALADRVQTQKIADAGRELSLGYDWSILAERMKRQVFEPLWEK